MSDSALTIKLGGTAGAHAASLAVLVERAEPGWVIVHGGGNEVGEWSRRLGIEPRDGRRPAGDRSGDPRDRGGRAARPRQRAAGCRLCRGAASPPSASSGADGDLLTRGAHSTRASARSAASPAWTGAARHHRRMPAGSPIVAPIARGDGPGLLNVNADEVAGAIAAARGGRLLLLTDVPGVLRGRRACGDSHCRRGRGFAGRRHRNRRHAAEARRRNDRRSRRLPVEIVDGTNPEAVRAALDGVTTGTTVTTASAARIG